MSEEVVSESIPETPAEVAAPAAPAPAEKPKRTRTAKAIAPAAPAPEPARAGENPEPGEPYPLPPVGELPRRKFVCTLKPADRAFPPREVEAVTPADAREEYKRVMGIVRTEREIVVREG